MTDPKDVSEFHPIVCWSLAAGIVNTILVYLLSISLNDKGHLHSVCKSHFFQKAFNQ